MIPRRAGWAVGIAALLHGLLILGARYRLSFDAYTHMLLADHYQQSWWSLWDPRWYTGFSVTTYPPLVHQLTALLGFGIGVDAAFGLLLWLVMCAFPMGVYGFARVFVDEDAAGVAALGAGVLPAVYLAAHTFGQLPTLFGTLFALFGLAALGQFLENGGWLTGALAVTLMWGVVAAHHGTLMLLPIGVLAVALHMGLNRRVSWQVLAGRLAVFGVLALLGMLAVVWPFWRWGLGENIQTPIDHASRHNFLTDLNAQGIFFWPVYGPLVVFILSALWQIRRRERLAPGLLFLALLVLGLGGTTPLPRWIFGQGWTWLTFDRFALWGAVVLLLFTGEALSHWMKNPPGWLGDRLRGLHIGRYASAQLLLPGWLGLCGVTALVVALFPTLLPTQPLPLDMQPLVDYLSEGDRADWLYLTFGFGDQFALLNRLAPGRTMDGSYHTARTLPELRTSGIGQIDTALWSTKGLAALDPILDKTGERGVRWGFVNRKEYIPVLRRHGWIYLETLENRVQVWENPAAVRPVSPEPPVDPLAAFSWGALPLAALVLAGMLAAAQVRARRFLTGVHQVAVGLIPVGAGLWYYREVSGAAHPRIYFTYTHFLFFAVDALVLVAVLAWLLERWLPPVLERGEPLHLSEPLKVSLAGPKIVRSWLQKGLFESRVKGKPIESGRVDPVTGILLGLALLGTASVTWSVDRVVSVTTAARIWLLFGLYLSLRSHPESWRAAALGSAAALVIQVVAGFGEFAAQSTAFLSPLGLEWPGNIEPAVHGASVVQLLNGERWLRVYGTLPHPNILGGMLLVWLAGPAMLVLGSSRGRWWAGGLFSAGCALLVLAFSRAAWLGFLAGAVGLLTHFRGLDRKRLVTLMAFGLVGFAIAGMPLVEQIYTRVARLPVHTETLSLDVRAWLSGQAREMIRAHPALGVGVGAFPKALADQAPGDFMVEPVHNALMLATSELGLAGGGLVAALGVAVLVTTWRAKQMLAIVCSAVVLGMLAAALFDHYFWSLEPGRVLFWWALGLWAGQVSSDGR